MKSSFLSILFLAGFGLAAHAEQINKWVDSEGKVHYSDQPVPEKAKAKSLNIGTQPAAPAAEGKASAQSMADKEQEYRKRKAAESDAKAKQEKADAEVRLKEKNCAGARGNLRTLLDEGRLVQINAAGEREYMDDTTRQRAIQDAQKSIDEWCK